MTLDDIRRNVAQQRRKRRTLTTSDVDRAEALAESARTYVRVYSRDGFVPNAYKYRAEIQYVQGMRASPGEPWAWSVSWTGAHRSYGAGMLEVTR